VEVVPIQVGWNALPSNLPGRPAAVDLMRPVRYQKDAELLAQDLLARCQRGLPLAPLQKEFSEAEPGTQVVDGSSDAPFREVALCMKQGECAVFNGEGTYYVLKRIN
jgi:hypothetical protein